jgi:hypothetical protein
MGTQRTLDSDRRWKGRYVAWARHSNLNVIASLLRDGMKMIEDKTHLRFVERSNEHDYIFFSAGEGCSSEEVGREVKVFRGDGGRLDLTIDPSWANAGNVAHEICHALGMFHEQTRQDRSKYINIDWDNIKDDAKHNYEKYDSSTGKDSGPYDFGSIMHYPATGGFAKNQAKRIITIKNLNGVSGYVGDPTKIGQRGELTAGDANAINGLPRGICHINKITAGGSIGTRTDTRDWSDGWTHVLTYAVGGKNFMLILKKWTGIVHVHELAAGEIGRQIDSRDWSEGWSTIDAISAGGNTYLLLLKVNDGTIHIHRLNANGSVGSQTDNKNWTSGYTSGKLFNVADKAFLFILKKGEGTVKIHSLSSGGVVGGLVEEYNWSSGWSSVCFCKAGGNTYLVLLKEGDGEIHVHRMEVSGKVGPRTDEQNWTSGYTEVCSYAAGGTTFLLFLKRGDGIVKVHSLSNDGKISNEVASHNWRSGWGSVAAFSDASVSYLILLRQSY